MDRSTLTLATLSVVATLGAAALAAPVAIPPVTNGGLGCFIVPGLMAIDADKAGKSDKLEQKDRESMVTFAASMRSDAR